MKCPNCGAEREGDALYCEKCGEEFRIVPDFDLEIEDAYRETIDNITNDLWNQETAAEMDIELQVKKKKRRKYEIYSLLLCVILVVCAAFGFGVHSFFYSSAHYQVEKARKLVAAEKYEKAEKYYERALELSDDVNVKIELAETYFYRNKKTEYEKLLWVIVRDPDISQEQLESAYGKLIAIYRSREDYQGINDFLLESGNEKLIDTYRKYVAEEPEFSILEGGYNKIQPLKLTAEGEGSIYYTLDGTNPDETSILYTDPILLERGEYVVRAVFVNDSGIRSKIADRKYLIEIEDLPEPGVSVLSGVYHTPELIEIEDDPENVYYTADGSEPDADSTMYLEAIPMPLGKSVYKFIRIESGVNSKVVTCHYELLLETDLTVQDAQKIVVDYCVENGKILDGTDSEDAETRYRYEYQTVRNINEQGDYYIIGESMYDTVNNTIRTGSSYAVDIYSGDLYLLNEDDFGYGLVFLRQYEKSENG